MVQAARTARLTSGSCAAARTSGAGRESRTCVQLVTLQTVDLHDDLPPRLASRAASMIPATSSIVTASSATVASHALPGQQ